MPKRRMKREAEIKRAYATHYYSDAGAPLPSISSHGAATSPEGAVRACVFRIFIGQYQKAVIVDRRTGAAIYTVKFGAFGLQVHYGSAVEKPSPLKNHPRLYAVS